MPKRVYVQVAEKALGRALPHGACVHHVNLDRTDNRPQNLVILETHAAHMALHRRLRVLQVGGNPWAQQVCCTCKLPLKFSEFYPQRNSRYQMTYRGQCKTCGVSKSRDRARRLVGHPPTWVESIAEKSARGRYGAFCRWLKQHAP